MSVKPKSDFAKGMSILLNTPGYIQQGDNKIWNGPNLYDTIIDLGKHGNKPKSAFVKRKEDEEKSQKRLALLKQ